MMSSPLRLPHITCACGATSGTEPSFDNAVAWWRAHACPAPGLCAICTDDTEPVRLMRLDGKDVRVCRRCEFEHPSEGRYSFNARPSLEPADLARSAGSQISIRQRGGAAR